MRSNNKGFTLIEVLAVIVIIGLLTGVTIPTVLKSINNGKNSSYNIMISNIIIASKELYEEIDNNSANTLYQYNDDGSRSDDIISINNNEIDTNLQTLVSNGYLQGTTAEDKTGKVIIEPINNEDIGYCKIKIKKNISDNYKVTYTVTNNDGNKSCPGDEYYENGGK